MNMDMADIQAMMDRIQELMEQGRMAEAQQALEELQEMMENLRLSENGQGGEGGQSSAQGLSDLLQDQQDLSDDAFNDLQQEFSNPDGQESQGEQGGEGQQQGSDFADRQGQLRERLENDRSAIEGELGDEGEDAQRSLEQAERAMRRAQSALEDGDLDGAVDQQAQAMDALRQAIRDVNRAQRSENSDAEQGNSDQQEGQGRDPLGRPQGGDGSSGTAEARREGQDREAQAAELLDEIRRRAGDRERSETERDYLKRLLDRF
jgi:hypothetical protein